MPTELLHRRGKAPQHLWPFALAVVSAGLALALTAGRANPLFPTPLFFAAIAISTWYGGVIPGLVTILLATFSLDYFFIPPFSSLSLVKPEAPYLIDFAIPALITCWFVRKRRIAEDALRDARDRLQSQIEEKQAELVRVSRLMSVGEMGVSIAHEVNQPLMAMVLNGDSCLKWLENDPPNLTEARAAVERMVREGTRAGEIVRRIRGLAQKTSGKRSLLDLNAIVRDVTALLGRTAARKGVTLRPELAPDLPRVFGDPVELQQVLFNLITNGIEAMSGAPQAEAGDLRIVSKRLAGSRVSIAVQDSGPGLPEGDPERLFEPFFTLKPGGLGIGLAISRTIIESHRGHLSASKLSTGAVFEFQLPSLDGDRQ